MYETCTTYANSVFRRERLKTKGIQPRLIIKAYKLCFHIKVIILLNLVRMEPAYY